MIPLWLLLSLPLPVVQDPAPSDPTGQDSPAAAPAPRAAVPLSDTLVITPTRTGSEARLAAPYAVDVVGSEQLGRRGYRTVPQALRDVPGVLVQETSHGQGSPYIRGFTSRRNLFLVDGIRLNNSVFRDGPNQYWNTVDASSLERLEVVKGPSSVLYGSDAVGGTVNAITKSPSIWDRPIGGSLSHRVAAGESSHVSRLELGGAVGEHTAWTAGLTRKDFGDVEAGGSTGTQENTGYDEWAGDLKVEHWLDDDARVTFGHYVVDQDDVPRTHRTVFAVPFEGTSVGSDLRHDFDQDRSLTYVKLETEGEVESTTTLSFQRQEEVRFRTRGSGSRDEQGFDVRTFGFTSAFAFDAGPGRMTAGVEWYRDSVDSFTQRFTSQTPADDIQGPVGDDARYESLGIFAEEVLPVGDRTDLTLGGRWTYNAAQAASVRDPVTDRRVNVSDDWNQLTGSARLSHRLGGDERTAVFGGLSQGFRAPNLSDLTRFDAARSNEFEVPATDLDEERFLTLELGAKHVGERLSWEASVYHTFIDDLIQRFPTGNVNGSGEVEITKDNVGDGEVYGLEAGLAWALDEDWSFFGDVAWIEGQAETIDGTGDIVKDDLTRLQPTTVRAGARWEPASSPFGAPCWAEVLLTWADDADRLSLRDKADGSRIPPGGTPGYTTLDLRAGWQVAQGWDVTFGVENVTDEDYRVHGSGSNRVGRNVYAGLTWSF